jgi:5'-nucleotidase
MSKFPTKLALVLFGLAGWFSFIATADEGLARDRAPLTILQINDVYSATPVDGGAAGGLARVASLKKRIMAEGRHVELIIAGDFLSPSVASSVFKGRQMVDALNVAGVDIGILGNHEFDFGPDALRQRMAEAKWTWLVSNVLEEKTGQPLLGAPKFLVRNYGALKVGYFGVCLASEEISRDRRVGIRIDDPIATAERQVAGLKRQGVNVIVAITHLDYADDRRLALRCPEIDVIIGGHDHVPITTHVGRTLISKAGSDARYVARIDLLPSSAVGVVEKQFELIPIGPSLPDDPATAAVSNDYEDRLGHALDVVVGRSVVPLDAVSDHVRARESNLGNLIADAMLKDTGAELAILNAGSIRSNRIFPPGALRLRDVISIHPFGGTICHIELDGAVILEALNHGVSRLGESVGRFPQVSGVSFRVDAKAPVGNRVREPQIGGKPLELTRKYRVAVGDYMLKGGDGYEMLAKGRVIVGGEAGNPIADVLSHHISSLKEVATELEGRIRFASEPAVIVKRRPVILDTDMGIDSILGLLYLLKEPVIDLRAITISHGVADVPSGAENARRILELTGNRKIPVAAGPGHPLEGQRAFPTFWKTTANELPGTKLPKAVSPERPESASDLLISQLEASAEPVTIIAMGPLTNLALALRQQPSISKKIAEIVIMGGAIDGPGNVDKPFVGIRNSVAEWNFYLDPQAASEVLSHGLKVRLIPVEATRSLPVTTAFRDRIRAAARDGTSELLLSLLDAVQEGIDGGWYFFWDTVAAVAVAHPEIMGSHEARVKVVTAEGVTLGQTVPASDGAPVSVAEEINLKTFEALYLKTILD